MSLYFDVQIVCNTEGCGRNTRAVAQWWPDGPLVGLAQEAGWKSVGTGHHYCPDHEPEPGPFVKELRHEIPKFPEEKPGEPA